MVWKLLKLLIEKEEWVRDIAKLKEDTALLEEMSSTGSKKFADYELVNMDRNYLVEKFFPTTLKMKRLSAIHPIVSKLVSSLDKMEQNLDKTLWLTKADAMLSLMDLALKCKESEIAHFQNQKASFRLYEGLAEAAPQSLLQSSIQIRDDKFFNQNATIPDMVTVILSVVSMVSASATMYEFSSEYV